MNPSKDRLKRILPSLVASTFFVSCILVAPWSPVPVQHAAAKASSELSAKEAARISSQTVLVMPHFNPAIQKSLKELSKAIRQGAKYLQSQGVEQWVGVMFALAQEYENQSNGASFGSGWIHRDSDGHVWLATNRHMVGDARTISYQSRSDEHGRSELQCRGIPVSYVHTDADIALIRLPSLDRREHSPTRH